MSSHSNQNSNLHYYEGDQSKLYSGILAHHGDGLESTESKTQIKRIWKVFWILLVITLIEVFIGMKLSHSIPKGIVISVFLGLTLFKAGYIVAIFMHLGDEIKSFMITVLIPLVLFFWFIIAFLADGTFWLHMNHSDPSRPTKSAVEHVAE